MAAPDGTQEGNSYDVRDDMVGGTDSQWCDAANWGFHITGSVDVSPSNSGVLSQGELAS